ncbi:ATP-binding protein [Nocardioides acrostichi]|uniref:ATP-binding protein n=1 Tax=Nocardioides acrostichi TaxID=2784339 RepID=A0A930Y7L4_9ACTN|nr:ATP-binding protein [Nocardioides acrostichi]MBF4162157.1 ATP-binding protein [Nocardioides acrostichi]
MTEIPAELEFDALAVPESMDDAHGVLEQLWALDESISPLDRMRFELAVIEILGNIIEHAYANDVDPRVRRVTMTLTLDSEHLVAELADSGVPVELDLSDIGLPDFEAESGRGLAMAQASVDEMTYSRDQGRNTWRLVCRRA